MLIKDQWTQVDEEATPRRHATLVLEDSLVPTSMYNRKDRLRTLRIELKIVTLTGLFYLIKIPNEMGNLRCLHLSNNDGFESLPEWVCDVCNLQTLRTQNCRGIKSLPKGIGKLVNL